MYINMWSIKDLSILVEAYINRNISLEKAAKFF